MPLSLDRATRHSSEWSERLASFPARSNWPVHVFHTCQLEVAVEIIRARKILCREDVPTLICDVANQGALWNNSAAHRYVRLYFRPRNGFHLKTEGIKSIGDPNRIDPHMAIPIAFAFDFVKVMTGADCGFVSGNFARTNAALYTADRDFDNLQFDLIYHDAALTQEKGNEVRNWRMSEVVVKRELALSSLSCVICRTIHEERTLRYALKDTIAPRIIVEQRGSIFMRRGMFIDEIYWFSGMLHIKFHGPTDYTKDRYSVKVTCRDGRSKDARNYMLQPGNYHFADLRASADAIWKIELESCVAYEGSVPSRTGLVVA